MVMPDLLHCKHLGTDAWFFGSVLELLCGSILPASRTENLDRVWSEIVEQYGIMKITHRFGHIKESMFKADNFPKLKGKASEIRWLVGPLAAVFRRHLDPSNTQHRYVLAALRFSAMVETILDEHHTDFCLPADAHAHFKAAIFGFLEMNTLLSDWYHERGIFLFNFTVKTHYLAHIALYSRWFNPRLAWAYAGEDFMQVCKKMFSRPSEEVRLTWFAVNLLRSIRRGWLGRWWQRSAGLKMHAWLRAGHPGHP